MANKPVVIHNRQKYFRKKQKQQNIQRFFNATASADLSDIITTVFLINQCLSPYYTVQSCILLKNDALLGILPFPGYLETPLF